MEAEKDTKLPLKDDAPDCQQEVKSENFKKPQMCLVGQRKSKGTSVRLVNCSTELQAKEEIRPPTDTPRTSVPGHADTAPVVSKISPSSSADTDFESKLEQKCEISKPQVSISTSKRKESSIPYLEPKWGGLPTVKYTLEVIKSGTILEPLNISEKSHYTFGRLANCDVQMAHPTVSRYHAVLQYSCGTDEKPAGFYLYDLGSTHGTFLNKSRIRPEMFVRVKVGHQIKLGCSSRFFLIQGPADDMEDESELTVTELKAKRQLELLQREEAEINRKKMEEEEERKREEEGINWGMGDDADEETDLSENPYAATTNEELYIDDPKKTLRGWFEREGHELEYDVEEKGPGHFLCRVEIPVEGARGGSIVAEALLKGKKKEAVAQCALEACRLLDRLGLLRQATHESRKRKAKNWEEEDFYDSDDDTFLDRTGAVEKKRQHRMQQAGRSGAQVETYQSLSEKHSEILSQITSTQAQLQKAQADLAKSKMKEGGDGDDDTLESFMSNLSSVGCADKKLISQLKVNLIALKKEEAQVRKLVNIARPASLPELIAPNSVSETPSPKDEALNSYSSNSRDRTIERNETLASIPHEDISHGGSEEGNNDKHFKIKKNSSEDSERSCELDVRMTAVQSTSGKQCLPPGESETKGPSNPSVLEDFSCLDKVNEPLPLKTVEESHRVHEESYVSEGDKLDEKSLREAEKRRKRNQRRLLLRKEKALERTKDQYDTSDPNYSVWMPPEDQSGDGKTNLNAKLGY